ncbi:MAG: protein kinase [Chloroflexota bacterium]
MAQEIPFGQFARQRRRELDLTQEELARRVGCAAITLRKIEAEDLRPSQQIAERLAMALAIPLDERASFVRQARAIRPEAVDGQSVPTAPGLDEIGREDLSGRAIRGYALAERIGAGGMGAVYRAVQPNVEREVAIKIILPAFANQTEFVRRFEAEAQLVARLEHPHIVPLYDYWREPGVAYLVMRLLRGGNIQELLSEGALPLEAVARFVDQICPALHAAHRIGVIHRDLKPANVLLDEDNNAYLADFGIAKNFGNPDFENQTRMDAVVGSLQYMSPEQIQSLTVRPQTDIYCLGIMLYEMLTGSLPFTGPTPLDMIRQHVTAPMPPLAARREGLPAELDAVIHRATAKDSQERYADILALQQDFQRAITNTAPVHVGFIDVSEEEEVHSEIANPFKGLRAFSEADADDFFGRETLVHQLLARLGEGGDLSRFLALIGPSGSGKSSVVKAGLIPALRRGALPGSENWFIVDMLPGSHPFEELEACLLRVAVNPPESLLSQLKDSNRGLLRAVRRILPPDPSVELVLIVDQFEELFTLVTEEADRALFLDNLANAILDERSRLRVIITLRADFTDRPLRYVDFGELLNRRFEFVLPLTPDELERSIVGPTQRVGLKLEKGLTSGMIRAVSGQPGALPLLQYALTELFEKRQGRTLTQKAYAEMGGVLGALGRRAETVFTSLDEGGQNAARQLFLRLVTLGEGIEDTRRRALRTELEMLVGSSAEDIQKSIEVFGRSRLLSFDRDPLTRGATVEVAHEALIREWERLSNWLAENRADIRLERQLAAAAADWEQAGQDASFLLTGARLAQFENWAEGTTLALLQGERDFLDASIAERDRQIVSERQRQQRELETAQRLAETERQSAARLRARNRVISAVGVVALVLALLAGFLGLKASTNAETAQSEAHLRATQQAAAEANFTRAEAQRLAAEANNALKSNADPQTIALLSIRSLNLQYSPQGDEALLGAAALVYPTQVITHAAPLNNARFSPDGRSVLLAGVDGFARLVELQTGQELRRFAIPQGYTVGVFSPDGRLIATKSEENLLQIWDAQSGQELQRFTPTSYITHITFTKDSQSLLLGADDQTLHLLNVETAEETRQWELQESIHFLFPSARKVIIYSREASLSTLWDLETDTALFTLDHSGKGMQAQSLSQDESRYAASYDDGEIAVWDLTTGKLINQIASTGGMIFSIAFSSNGQLLLAGGADDILRILDIQTGQVLHRFVIGSTIFQAEFSPDGRLAMAMTENATSLWEGEAHPRYPLLAGHSGYLSAVSFSPDGATLATADSEGQLRLWDIQSGVARWVVDGAGSINYGLEFSPDGRYLLTGNWDGAALLWGAQTGDLIRQYISDRLSVIQEVAFSPDGRYFLAAGRTFERTTAALIWEAETGKEFRAFEMPVGAYSVDYAPDGGSVLTANEDGIVRIWDVTRGELARQFTASAGNLNVGRFSPDGKIILTAGNDGVARLWDALSGEEIQHFTGHSDGIMHAAFSPDGKYVATASYDNTVRLWEVSNGQELRRYIGHTAGVENVTFSPDGKLLVSVADDATARLWDVDIQATMRSLCSILLRDFTETEQRQYTISGSFPTCAYP